MGIYVIVNLQGHSRTNNLLELNSYSKILTLKEIYKSISVRQISLSTSRPKVLCLPLNKVEKKTKSTPVTFMVLRMESKTQMILFKCPWLIKHRVSQLLKS